jgi:hypothetical protein
LKNGEANSKTEYEPNRKMRIEVITAGKRWRSTDCRVKLVPSPLENVSVNTFESEKAVELSIRVDDGQCSDISSVVGDDVNQISPVVEETRVSLESREVKAMEEVEVSIPSSSSTHIVTSTGDSNREYEASSIRSEKLKAIKSSQDRRFILNIGGIKFETCADTMASDPNSLLFD